MKINFLNDDYMNAAYYDNKIAIIRSLLNNDDKKIKWECLSHESKHDIFNLNDTKIKNDFDTILNYHTNFA